MKLPVFSFNEIPSHLGEGVCVYGDATPEMLSWAAHHKLEIFKTGPFTNFSWKNTTSSIEDMFISPEPFDYTDGFSPNLNKHLHLGHLSNLVYAKAFQSLGVSKSFVALLGDTVHGQVNHKDALDAYNKLCATIGYKVHDINFASKLSTSSKLIDGAGFTKTSFEGVAQDYTGTQGFLVNGNYIVGVKSSGETSYFYHDVAFAEYLQGQGKTTGLYLTGLEQGAHFKALHTLFPNTKSVGLGLVCLDGAKMSSSLGNTIYLSTIWDELLAKFKTNELVWNVLAGFVLKTTPSTAKKLNLELLNNPKNSPGLYLSYTLAKLKSAGLKVPVHADFKNKSLAWALLISKSHLNPGFLLTALTKHCKGIASLYEDHYIADNPANQELFKPLAGDLLLGLKLLGFLEIEKV